MAFAKFFWRAAVKRNGPYILLDALRRVLRIGIGGVGEFEIASARVDDRFGVGCPAEHPEILAVVVLVRSDLPRLVAAVRRGLRDPKIASSIRIENPRDTALGWRRGQLRRKRRTQKLFEGRRFLRLRCRAYHQSCKDHQRNIAFHQQPPRIVEFCRRIRLWKIELESQSAGWRAAVFSAETRGP